LLYKSFILSRATYQFQYGRQLHYHPHIHFIVPGGAFDSERNCWNKANSKFLVPVKALKYLSNYVYRTAITNNRIVCIENGEVTFKYKESSSKKIKYQTVTSLEFMRRFLQHVLPVRFQKVRYYGFLSSASKIVWQQICNYFDFKPSKAISSNEVNFNKRESFICPDCKSGMIHCRTIFRKQRTPPNFLLETISEKLQQQTV